MKFGDAVLYHEGGKIYNALVIGPITPEANYKPGDPLPAGRPLSDHVGENGEPLVTLIFTKETLDMHSKPQDLCGTGSWGKLMQMRTDVAHISHEFSAAAKKLYGNHYSGGRWQEAANFIPGAAPVEESEN